MVGTGEQPPKKGGKKKEQPNEKPTPESQVGTGEQPPKPGFGD